MKRLINILIFVLSCTTSFGQGILNEALIQLQTKQYDSAKVILDKVVKLQAYQNSDVAWYYRGFTYKELFKRQPDTKNGIIDRDSAKKSLTKAYQLAKSDTNHASLKNNIGLILKYLAETYNNDAAIVLNDAVQVHSILDSTISDSSIKNAISNFKTYKSIMKLLNPAATFADMDTQYNLQLGSIYQSKYSNSKYKDSTAESEAIGFFNKVLSTDSTNISAYYNLGIMYYNKAVQILNNMDFGASINQLNENVDVSAKLFKKALPYMMKAYKLNPNRKETLMSLAGIYYSLNDYKQSNFYKAKALKLENK